MTKVENRGLPAAVECERLILGVAMMDGGVMHDVRPLLAGSDFSVDDHGRIWETMATLYDAGKSFDRISVFESMQKRKQPITLSFLLDLEEGMPHLPSIDNYVQMVKDKSLLRNIVFACRSVASRCLDGTEAPQAVLDSFGELALNLLPKDGRGGLQSAGELIDEYGVEALLTPRIKNGLLFPWGWMNRWTCGMLPAELWVLAGHTSTGKTSAMLQHAVYAAQKGHGVAVFSLEVGKKALFQKAVYQLARVDSEKAKNGEDLSDEERGAVRRATNELYDLPIYFDTTATTVPAIHAAVRRRRVRGHVDHVIVDYLQLLGNSERRDNRAQAVGANVWALKMLATDFQIPVLLLSQFSRPSKEGKPRRPELSDLKECLAGDSRVIDAYTGRPIELRNLRPGTKVMGISEYQKVGIFSVENVWSTGIREVFRLRTRTGRELTATANHPLLTPTGWKPLSELSEGDRIATPMRMTDIGPEVSENSDLCRLLGYLCGDGSYLNHSSISFISADKDVFYDCGEIIKAGWPTLKHTPLPHPEGYFAAYYTQVSADGYGHPHGNPLREWLRGIGVYGCRESTKRIPDFVFESGITGAVNFLAGYLATDGCVKFSKQYSRAEVQFDSTSKGLLEDVQLLLLKIGVVATLNRGTWNTKSTKPIYRLCVSIINENMRRFCSMVNTRGKKGRYLRDILAKNPRKETGGGVFNLPPEVSELCWERSGNKQKGGGWTHQGKTMRRSSARDWASSRNDGEVLMWANSDLLWEPIMSIEPCGMEEVFDFTVPGCANLIANGIVAHNSGDIENHANGVWFLHRDAQEDSDQVSVDFMLPKQRDGRRNIASPMWFFPRYQRFEEQERG